MKPEKDDYVPDNMARAAFLGKALQFLPKVYEALNELDEKEVSTLSSEEQEEIAAIKEQLGDLHLG